MHGEMVFSAAGKRRVINTEVAECLVFFSAASAISAISALNTRCFWDEGF